MKSMGIDQGLNVHTRKLEKQSTGGNTIAMNFILALMCTSQKESRCYTPDLHVGRSHFSICPTMSPRLASQYRRNQSSVSVVWR
jgi:hypothetical protein